MVRAGERRGSWRLALLLILVSVPPAGGLAWLGFQLLESDRTLVAQRDLERRQAAAPALARALDQILTAIEGDMTAAVPPNAVRLVMNAAGTSRSR